MEKSSASPAGRGAISSTITQIQAERRWFTLMRLAFSGVCLTWLLLISWALPWGPISRMVPDYSAAAVLGLILAVATIASSLGFFFLWRPTFRGETLQDFARVLFGGELLVRTRSQFRSRLGAECRQAAKDATRAFSLVVIRADEPPKPNARTSQRKFEQDLPAIFVRGIARGDDIVGDAWPCEVWILAIGADDESRSIITKRLEGILGEPDATIPQLANARIGSCTYGDGCASPREMLDAAYQGLASADGKGDLAA